MVQCSPSHLDLISLLEGSLNPRVRSPGARERWAPIGLGRSDGPAPSRSLSRRWVLWNLWKWRFLSAANRGKPLGKIPWRFWRSVSSTGPGGDAPMAMLGCWKVMGSRCHFWDPGSPIAWVENHQLKSYRGRTSKNQTLQMFDSSSPKISIWKNVLCYELNMLILSWM